MTLSQVIIEANHPKSFNANSIIGNQNSHKLQVCSYIPFLDVVCLDDLFWGVACA